MNGYSEINVRNLPEWVFDHRAPVWWGNLWLIIILMTFAMQMIGSYFYLAKDFQQWPPPQSNTHPALEEPLPDPDNAAVTVAVLLLGCIPAAIADWSARRFRQWPLRLSLTVTSAAGIAAMYLRYLEFRQLSFSWDDNAYGSIVWAILALHLLFIFIATVEMLLMTYWTWTHHLDEKHAFEVTVVSLFWYWMALVWLPSYAVVYWSPRFL